MSRKTFMDMLNAATERARKCDQDWSKDPDGIDLTPSVLRGAKRAEATGKPYIAPPPPKHPEFGSW